MLTVSTRLTYSRAVSCPELQGSRRRIAFYVGAAALGVFTGTAAAAPGTLVATPTFAQCTQLELKAPIFRGSRAAATVACLRPTSIRMKASARWTTCPTTPDEEPCVEATVRVDFRSGKVTSVVSQESWGGENLPGAGIFALRGTGTYTCKAQEIDRQSGRIVIRSYSKTLALRDAAAGFAVIGNKIKVATSVDPGRHGPFGQDASVRLGQPQTCELAALPASPEAVREVWPGAGFSLPSFRGTSTTLTSSGTLPKSLPVPASAGYAPGTKLDLQVTWSSTVVVVPALRR